MTSGRFLAEISVRSPRLIILLLSIKKSGSKYPKNEYLILRTETLSMTVLMHILAFKYQTVTLFSSSDGTINVAQVCEAGVDYTQESGLVDSY